MEQKTVTVKFDGQTHQVELTTVTSVLLNYAAILKAAADQEGIGDDISISIDATERGSLDVVLSIATEGFKGIMGLLNDNAGAIESIFMAATGIYTFKKWLARKKNVDDIKNEEDGSKTITADGQTTNITNSVFNLYTNTKVTDKVDSTFRILEENPAVSGFELIEDKQTFFHADRSEFAAIAESPNYEGEDTRHAVVHDYLTVIKPCFANSTSRTWKFILNGNEISAPIADVKFLQNLSSYNFTRGTKLEVDMDVLQEYKTEYGDYVNKKYTITNVENVIPPVETLSIFDDLKDSCS